MTENTILIVDDNEDIRFALSVLLRQSGYEVLEASDPFSCEQVLTRITPSLILLDMNFSRDTTSGEEGLSLLNTIKENNVPIILMTAWANVDLIVKGIRLGAADFIEKPWQKKGLLQKISACISAVSAPKGSKEQWIVHSPQMQTLEHRIQQFAQTDANILILGENGTGKSMLAQRIHNLSARHTERFVSLNMAAISDSLFESELFGHKRGAFTDAKQDRLGVFSRANSGTLFMDEIGTLPINLQPKLLQVLETGEFVPLGADHSSVVDIRLIAATNQNLHEAIENNNFRQDLFYRLNTFVITIPPLRERTEDLPYLAESFIVKFCTKYKKPLLTIEPKAMNALIEYHWPGNVRELSHVIERAVLICSGNNINPADILIDTATKLDISITGLTLEQLEKQRIEQALDDNHGKLASTANALGISRHSLKRRLEKYKLESSDEG
jgi:DNA-binding NtrC family response regulator